ncbi:hypothetical protein GOBAR_DD34759 [Gossypium barbadense]|nr:hypothetical protein GOBAR_DD34759 [Gossypium barbadense]
MERIQPIITNFSQPSRVQSHPEFPFFIHLNVIRNSSPLTSSRLNFKILFRIVSATGRKEQFCLKATPFGNIKPLYITDALFARGSYLSNHPVQSVDDLNKRNSKFFPTKIRFMLKYSAVGYTNVWPFAFTIEGDALESRNIIGKSGNSKGSTTKARRSRLTRRCCALRPEEAARAKKKAISFVMEI